MAVDSDEMELETEEEAFFLSSFSTLMLNPRHAGCYQPLCINLGGLICVSKEMQQHLQKHDKVVEAQSDWETLLMCCQAPGEHLKLLQKFAFSKCHRLRFKYHRDAGVYFARQLITDAPDSVWGVPVAKGFYRSKLSSLVEHAPHGGEYRIFDLCNPNKSGIHNATCKNGGDLEPPKSVPSHLYEQRALLFALKHGQEGETQTLDELLARYQFFVTYWGREKEDDRTPVEALWVLYAASAERFSRRIDQLSWANSGQFVLQLRDRLDLLGFSTHPSATYHGFKHMRIAQDFGAPENASPEEIVECYFKAIREVIAQGEFTIQPTQFGAGSNIAFSYVYPDSGKHYVAHVKAESNAYTFVLTCY